MFGPSASLPMTKAFLVLFARKPALENSKRNARLNKEQKAHTSKTIYNHIFNILYPLFQKQILPVRHCKHDN